MVKIWIGWSPRPPAPPCLEKSRFEWVFLNDGFPWDFFELGIFLKRNDPLKILRNKMNMKNIGTKSINMSDIMVYLAKFSTAIDKNFGSS